MRLERPQSIRRDSAFEQGFSVVSAIFLMVTLALMGAFMITFSATQHSTATQDVQGSRAYQAARAGIEWGLYQVLRGSNYCTGATAAGVAVGLPALADDLAGFSVAVTCDSKTAYTDGGASGNIYQITSLASSGIAGTSSRVERKVRVTVSGP
jgi:MSHA biogenesis protein MshP